MVQTGSDESDSSHAQWPLDTDTISLQYSIHPVELPGVYVARVLISNLDR